MGGRRWLAMMVAALGVLVAACSDDDGGVIAPGPTTTAGGGEPGTTVEGIDPMEGAGTDTVDVERAVDTAHLVALRAARHEGFDRVVFEFDGPAPGYRVGYARRPITEDASGEEVRVDGGHVVEVRLFPSSTVRLDGEAPVQTYTGPARLRPGTPEVVEIVRTGDFEAVLTWVVGLADRVDFRVSLLEDPHRIVVDFRNH